MFWDSCPADLKPYEKAHELKLQEQDVQMWNMGMYIESAVRVAIDRSLNVKKANQEYIKEPMLSKLTENDGLTQEEIDERELKKMIAYEEMWIVNGKIMGLPETKIK